jgi:hypothetical protein
MALTLQLADPGGDLLSESYAILDEELLEYLSRLAAFPALRGLGELSPEEETPIGEEARESLAREALELAALVQRREVPRPPDWVGLQGTGDLRLGEELGWTGLLGFLRRLEHLIHLARKLGLELWALPND